jgi:hypothetical protein
VWGRKKNVLTEIPQASPTLTSEKKWRKHEGIRIVKINGLRHVDVEFLFPELMSNLK